MSALQPAPGSAFVRPDGLRRVNIIQGETRVSNDPKVVFTTVLGSCISACLYDPDTKVGGINHFLLAEPGGDTPDPSSMQRYGVYAMELLINGMLAKGAVRHRLRARIYGGASMHRTMRDIGGSNAAFARAFLHEEGIALVAADVGGTSARRVEFRAALGLSRCKLANEKPAEVAPKPVVVAATAPAGDCEFF